MDVQWAVTDAFTLYGGLALQKAELGEDFCQVAGPPTAIRFTEADCLANDPADFAPEGTRLPTHAGIQGQPHRPLRVPDGRARRALPGAPWCTTATRRTALLPSENDVLGEQDAYTLVDLSFGIEKEKWRAELFVENAFDERAEPVPLLRSATVDPICRWHRLFGIVTTGRALIGLKFSQKF